MSAPETLSIFMLVKTSPEWLGFPVPTRFAHLRKDLQPIIRKYADRVTFRWYDAEFYTTRLTDLWLIEAKSSHDYEMMVEELRETPLWDRYFQIVEIIPAIENAYARNYDEAPVGA
ncbi:darcynin family protein [Methylobacterium sp. ID0610]|uniref:darcynin family protein n=1 Tax=Methylobacterium carpenticola TaxID=3344827 RepID=UPI003680AA45